MSYTDWKNKTNSFKKIDVRGIQGNFFQGLKKQAMNTPVGEGLEIVQSFDPIPLYEVMEQLGFEHHTEQIGDSEFHAYFYRTEQKLDNGEIPMRPAALTNMPLIDEELGKVAVQFWDVTWMWLWMSGLCRVLRRVQLSRHLYVPRGMQGRWWLRI